MPGGGGQGAFQDAYRKYHDIAIREKSLGPRYREIASMLDCWATLLQKQVKTGAPLELGSSYACSQGAL